jgi:cytochrome c553
VKKRALAAVVASGVVGALALGVSGLVDISARSGHWPITYWVLHTAMRRSVETHAAHLEAPPLDEPGLVLRGAGHYATGCAPCHGGPGDHERPIPLSMSPESPFLPRRVERWTPEQLFWIVRNGVKFTAMPAWAAPERDDEVWAVVAFLLRLPQMTRKEYDALTGLEDFGLEHLEKPLATALANCARCHGRDGEGRGTGAFPRLTGQHREYLLAALNSYAHGTRASGIMQPAVAGLDEPTRRALAEHYAEAGPWRAPRRAVSRGGGDAQRGRAIAHEGVPRRNVPACVHCHGPAAAANNPLFPRLAGQDEAYLVAQLELWSEGIRGGTAWAVVMNEVARDLEPDEIRDVAAWFASQPAE